jgi:transcriptional regulator with PAS, ATPase and Fis domain
VVEIALPPLRERADDIQLLASEFLERYANQNGKKVTGFTDDAWQWLLTYNWPGNVRELKNSVERGVIMTRGGDKLTLQDLMPRHLKNTAGAPSSVTIPVGSSMADAQRQLVLRTFANANGDANRTAKSLGMEPDDVRRDLLAMLNGAASEPATEAAARAKPVKKK